MRLEFQGGPPVLVSLSAEYKLVARRTVIDASHGVQRGRDPLASIFTGMRCEIGGSR